MFQIENSAITEQSKICKFKRQRGLEYGCENFAALVSSIAIWTVHH